MATSEITVYVAVYEGEPLDYQKTRHTMWWFQFMNPDLSPVAVHIVGPVGEFKLDTRDGYDPTRSHTFAGKHRVGQLLKPISKAGLVSFVSQTPIRNLSYEFDCQKWVGDALEKLRDAGYLTSQQCADGIDGMVELTLEAKDG